MLRPGSSKGPPSAPLGTGTPSPSPSEAVQSASQPNRTPDHCPRSEALPAQRTIPGRDSLPAIQPPIREASKPCSEPTESTAVRTDTQECSPLNRKTLSRMASDLPPQAAIHRPATRHPAPWAEHLRSPGTTAAGSPGHSPAHDPPRRMTAHRANGTQSTASRAPTRSDRHPSAADRRPKRPIGAQPCFRRGTGRDVSLKALRPRSAALALRSSDPSLALTERTALPGERSGEGCARHRPRPTRRPSPPPRCNEVCVLGFPPLGHAQFRAADSAQCPPSPRPAPPRPTRQPRPPAPSPGRPHPVSGHAREQPPASRLPRPARPLLARAPATHQLQLQPPRRDRPTSSQPAPSPPRTVPAGPQRSATRR